jgi:ornithine cyclodeaminase
MPAWHATAGGYAGVKIVSVVPGNAARGKPSVVGAYLLLDGDSGEPLAMLDGQALTAWRTAGASALAASYLARPDSRRMVMVGAGTLAPRLIEAHASVRPIEAVAIWNRNPERALVLASRLDRPGLRVTAVDDLAAAVAGADLVSAATMSRAPLVEGAWLAPGVHLDLVGAYNPGMREVDDAAVARASVYVDTRAGALAEAGDIVQAIAAGALDAGRIAGDLFDLCRRDRAWRRSADEITLFKSVGTAIEDLAAAVLVFERSFGRA